MSAIEPCPPLDWIPEMFRAGMRARDAHGVLYRIDWSVPGGQWAPIEQPDKPEGKP